MTQDYDYHMYIRHLVTPQEAIAAYFTKTQEEYNQALEELQAQIQEQDKDVPTYEELEKQNAELLYQVLTGEELDVTTN